MAEAFVDQEPRSGGFVPFLSEALNGIGRREMLLPALVLMVVLTASNAVILLNMPVVKGVLPPAPFLAAAFVRLAGLLILVVAILRIATASARPKWLPDGGFWLYALTVMAAFGLTALLGLVLGDRSDFAGLLLNSVVSTILLAPFAAWFVAIAAARPLAWNPGPWMRAFRIWLLPLLFWLLLLVMPLGLLHASIDMWLIKGAGEWFWPAVLFDGPLSTAMALLALALNATAYRRVAQA